MSGLTRRPRLSALAALSTFALVGTTLAFAPTASAAPDGSGLVISEVYGGGGNSGATFTHDFIEIHNPTDAAISVDGWSVQWRSGGSTSAATVTPLTGSVPAGAHYLVQQAQGAGGTQPLPTPDATGTVTMGGSSGTAILANSTAAVNPGIDSFAGDPAVVDLVGVGSNVWEGTAAATGMSNTASAARDENGTDTDDNSADFTAGAATPEGTGGGVEPPAEVTATIPEIQGDGPVSPLVGDIATTEGVVTAAYPTGGFYGFYLQVPGTGGADHDPAQTTSSQAIFVRQTQTAGDVTVQPGDHVQVTGAVAEFAGATQLSVTDAADIQALAEPAAAAEAVTAWPASATEREALEGMLYRPIGDFTVTETYQTMNFGEVGLARGDKPLIQWTDAARPGSPEADAIKADNALRGIVLDDGASTDFRDSTDLTPSYISNTDPVRVGANATFDQDVIFTEGGAPSNPTYRLQPLAPVVGPDNTTSPAAFENTRTDAPDATTIGDADIKVASFNVLNYFTTLGDPSDDNIGDNGCLAYADRDGDGNNVRGGCDPRGAWDPEDLERQQTKIVKAINALDADVVGLMEIENSAALGEDADEATNTLVDALNADAGSDIWAANPSSADLPPAADQDVITNAIIYKVASVERTGDAHALGDQSGSDQAFGNAREPIAQAFTATAGGAPFLFVVNHFKSKGSAGPWPGDADTGDGQGASNESRIKQATALRDWLPAIQTETGADSVLLAGDFNAYGQEDPLKVLYDAGYVDVEQKFELGEWSYSYQGLSGSLDHILVNEDAAARSTGADIWNINAGEALALEYSRWNYGATDFHTATPYRSSDHDPVVLGLSTDAAPVDDQVTLNLLGVNDFHGRINSNTVKWAGTVEQLTEQGGADSTLMVGAGDLIGASEFASAVDGDQPTIDVMNALGLDASAVGNHEFDKGFDDLRDRVIGSDDARNAQWDYLGANVYDKGTTDPALPEYATFEVDGVTVAVVGAVTEETASLVSPAGIADIEFGDPVEAVNRVAGELSDGDDANGEADVIIASFHAGANTGEDSTYEEEVAKGGEFAEMANLDPAVDVIFNGHTHQTYAWDAPIPGDESNTRPILQTGQYADNVGQVQLTVDTATGDVVDYTARNVARTTEDDAVLAEKYPRVAEVKKVVDAALAHAAEIGNQPVGEITADISRAKTASGGEDRGSESTLGDLVGNALRDGLPADFEADLGITNPGGLRTDLVHAGDTSENPANTDGVVTFAEANSVLPFVNNVSLVDLTGAQLRDVLEQQWQPDGSSRPFLALGLSDNVRVTQDPTKPRGERITSVIIDGQRLDPTATYSVSTFSFLAAGGDNFTAFKEGTSRDTGLVDRELWMDYLEGHQPLSPDFARQQVVENGFPSVVGAGQEVAFDLSNLDLTSHDSPANTEVRVFLTNGTESLPMGSFPVTDGSATVAFTAPADLEGSWTVGVIADPSYTQVGLPLPAVDTTLTAEAPAEAVPYGTKGLVVATLESDNPSTGQVELLHGDDVVGTGMLTGGTANIRFDSTKLEIGANELTVRYAGDEQNNASETTVQVEVTKAAAELSTTLSTTKPVVKADSIVVTTTVTAPGFTPTGYVVLYVDGAIRTLADLEDGTAEMGVTPLDTVGDHTIQVVYYGDDHTKVAMSNDTVTVVKARPKMTVKVKPEQVHVKKTRAKVIVLLEAIGQTPSGKVKVKVAGDTYSKKLRSGKATIKLKKFAKKGKHEAVVVYSGNKLNKSVKKKVTIKVVK